LDSNLVKIAAIVTIGVLAGLLVSVTRADLGANLGIAILAYLFGNDQGKRAAQRER